MKTGPKQRIKVCFEIEVNSSGDQWFPFTVGTRFPTEDSAIAYVDGTVAAKAKGAQDSSYGAQDSSYRIVRVETKRTVVALYKDGKRQ